MHYKSLVQSAGGWISARRKGRSFVIALSLLALLVAYMPPALAQAQPPAPEAAHTEVPSLWLPSLDVDPTPPLLTPRIEFTSDRTITLTAVGETGALSAVVLDDDGELDPNAQVEWSSSNPDVISVSQDGVVTARAALGSAVITASYGEVQPEVATVVVAELTPDARLIESRLVLQANFDPTRIVLMRNPTTEALQVGHVIMSGDQGGVLARILAIELRDDHLILTTEAADLIDVFEELQLEAYGAFVELDAEGWEVDMAALNADGEVDMQAIADTLQRRLSLQCKAEGKRAPVTIDGGGLDFKLSVRPRMALDISRRTVQRMELYLEASMRVTLSTGEVKYTQALSGKVTCEVRHRAIRLGAVPIAGPFSIGGMVTPSLGIELEAAFTLGSFSITGPRLDYGYMIQTGIGYNSTSGFHLINERGRIGDGLTYPSATGSLNQEFTAKIEPFFALTASLNLFIGPWSLTSFRFLQGKLYGGGELKMSMPPFHEEVTYRGPRWELYVGASVNLKPLAERAADINRALRRLGVPVGINVRLDFTLFEYKNVLYHAPEPSLSASPLAVRRDETTSLEMTIPHEDRDKVIPLIGAGHDVRFLAFKQPPDGEEPILIGIGALSESGSATTQWTPGTAPDGAYEVTALIYDSIFGHHLLGLPYGTARDNRVTVQVLGDEMSVLPSRIARSTQINETLVGSFTIFNPKTRDIQYITSAGGGGPLRVTNNGAGVVPAEANMRVEYELTCPATPGSHDLNIAVVFQELDDTVLSDTGLVEVELECQESPDPGEGALSSSHGDPHLLTADGYFYDFQAVGDYILTRSTDPEDDFEVQIRYRRPEPGDPWQGEFSFNYAAAMMVHGDRVEVYSTATGVPAIYVNGDPLNVTDNLQHALPGGGSLAVAGVRTTITWRDHTWIRLDTRGWLGQAMDRLFVSVDLFFSGARQGKVEGLLGNFDGDPDNDIRLQGGDVLTDPTPEEIHGVFRDSWRVPLESEESLFSLGPDLYLPNYPATVYTIDDFAPEVVAFAREECLARGIVTPKTLETCIYDVALTGDPNWADVALGVDPNAPRVTMSPGFAFAHSGRLVELSAFVAGVADRTLVWEARDGVITPGDSYTATYGAPFTAGTYVITATLAADASVFDVATIQVVEDGKSYWTGRGDGSRWTDPENWSFNTLPGPTDDVIIDVPEHVVIRYSGTGDTSIRSLTSNAHLVLTGGAFSVAEQATLTNRVTVGGSVLTGGHLDVGGETTVNGALTLGVGGRLTGSGDVTVNGVFTWSGGEMRGGGTTLINNEMHIIGSSSKSLFDRTLENAGIVRMTGTGDIFTRETSVINNLPGALFDVQSDSNLARGDSDFGVFNNAGMLRKSGGDGTSVFRLTFHNLASGTVEVESGTLLLRENGSIGGAVNVFGPGALNFEGTFTPGFSLNGAAFAGDGTVRLATGRVMVEGNGATFDSHLWLSSGNLEGPGDVTVNGLFTWSGGILQGGGTIQINDEMHITGSSSKSLRDITLENAGVIRWSGSGNIQTHAGAVIDNLAGALFDVQTDANITRASSASQNTGTFNNAGTLLKSTGDGTTILDICYKESGDGKIEELSGEFDIRDVCPAP